MAARQLFKRIIYQFDLFCSSELLRYRSQSQYKTLTGGLLSLAIICVVAVGFGSMVADTLQRQTITSSRTTEKKTTPSLAILKPGIEGMFMFGLSIQSFDTTFQANLSYGPQYFSFRVYLQSIGDGINTIETQMSLQKCTREHWGMVSSFQELYGNLGAENWLCLPLGATFPLEGSFTTKINSYIIIEVLTCQNSTSNNTCAPQEEIDALFSQYRNFYLTLNYVNPVINPNKQDFLSYYVEGNDYIVFSKKLGVQAWLLFSDYTVTTDDSILPFTQITKTTGCIVEEKATTHPYSILGKQSLAWIYLAKSDNSLRYYRQVQKISAVFSYIGGLIGAITAILFLIKSYTDTSLQVAIGLSLFEVSRQQKINKKDKVIEEDIKSVNYQGNQNRNFNFFVFMRIACYRLMRFCGWVESSQREEYIQNCQQQAIKQMDIQILLRRLIKLQTCISHLFTSQELEQIREGQRITIKSAQRMRSLLLKMDEGRGSRASKGQNKAKMELNDVVIEQNSASQGQSHFESAQQMHKNHENISNASSMVGREQQKLQKSLSGALAAEKLREFIITHQNCERQIKFGDMKGRSCNKIYPDAHNFLPPINQNRFILPPNNFDPRFQTRV